MTNKELCEKFDMLVRQYLDGHFLEFSRNATKNIWLVRIGKIESAIELKKQVAALRSQLPENSFLIELTSEQTAIANQIGEVYRNHTSIWRSIK